MKIKKCNQNQKIIKIKNNKKKKNKKKRIIYNRNNYFNNKTFQKYQKIKNKKKHIITQDYNKNKINKK